ncbi:hypothetical protein OEA41_002590 [Lepraria neglecta]|uniref:Uncharacterized protein n=1 Tax=Lepraria neglecta TaxID=209136 RepID=A0AAD9ZCN9_9LECA|nr:hypothetical protein OEA41_002590 [Lepraria neglecta]
MSTRPKKRRSTGRTYETEPNVKQVYFPAPKRAIKERGPAWSAPSKYQPTITQMNPLRSFYHPNSEDEDLKSDHGNKEEEESYVDSPVRRKRRKILPEKTPGTTRKIGTRNAQRQTITQMDPFRSIYYPDTKDEDLDYEDEAEKENHAPLPSGRKRRKIKLEKTPGPRIAKGVAKSKATKARPHLSQEEEQRELPQTGKASRPSKPQTAAALLLPPQTPRSLRKREIPSSQSPADTPLSTQSRRSIREYTRSPLKERSTHFILPKFSSCKGPRWAKKLEVADGMESREDDSPLSTRTHTLITPIRPDKGLEDTTTLEAPHLSPNDATTEGAGAHKASDSRQCQGLEIKESSRIQIGREILDSDEEKEEEEEEYFNASAETQAVLVSSSAPSATSSNHEHVAEPPSNLINFQPERTSTQPNNPKAQKHSRPSQLSLESNSASQESIQRLQITKQAPTDPSLAGLTTASNPGLHRTKSEQASAQLFNDLRRITEPILETESQFEGAWNSYHPAENDNPEDDRNNLLSSPTLVELQSSAPLTVPTQPLPTRITTNCTPLQSSTQFKIPVPPSQATTTDVTQPSPRKMPSLQGFLAACKYPASSQIQVPSSPPPMLPPSSQIQVPSSPPPMPPLSSSPVAGRKATDPWIGFEWNGIRLTDSQLLPESLLNDSLVGPNRGSPGLSQENLEEE